MKLVIGGYAQGKLNYLLKGDRLSEYEILDGMLPEEGQMRQLRSENKTVVINHFHQWVKTAISQGTDPEEEIMRFAEKMPDSIIISDEVGNGIVPLDPFEREYRERTGRLLVRLAEISDEVVRVICGIGQRIK